jgi:hypothetical protein
MQISTARKPTPMNSRCAAPCFPYGHCINAWEHRNRRPDGPIHSDHAPINVKHPHSPQQCDHHHVPHACAMLHSFISTAKLGLLYPHSTRCSFTTVHRLRMFPQLHLHHHRPILHHHSWNRTTTPKCNRTTHVPASMHFSTKPTTNGRPK